VQGKNSSHLIKLVLDWNGDDEEAVLAVLAGERASRTPIGCSNSSQRRHVVRELKRAGMARASVLERLNVLHSIDLGSVVGAFCAGKW
jgi:hypothetical protein